MLTGGCMCRACRFEAAGNPLWSAQCHCRDCQRAAGADYVSWIGLDASAVTWSGPRRSYNSSPGVTRTFCGTCGTPLSFEADRFPGEVHVYAPGLDDPSLYRPARHVHWAERVPWLALSDDLPKHGQGSDSPEAEKD